MIGDLTIETGADGIDENKRLITLSGGKSLSLSDRLSDRLSRLTWRTPLHRLRLKGRHPLKLIAAPHDPLPGNPAHGAALLSGALLFRGELRQIDALSLARPDFSRRYAEHLHSFDWLRDLAGAGTRAQGAPVAEAIMRLWLASHAEKIAEPAWRADLWGRRILNWTAHAPLILSSADLVYRSLVLNTLARGARHLERTAEKMPPGPARIAVWCGITAAGLLIPGGDSRHRAGEAGLARALGVSLFRDGGIVQRSPAAQLDVIMLLTLLRESYSARRLEPLALIEETLTQMVPVLLGSCHSDKGLASWQGGAPVPGGVLDAIIAATRVRARPLRQAREWGYQRMAAGQTVLIIDAAPPPVSRLIDGGCASTLAIEVSDGPNRIIVNCGGARALIAPVPDGLADGLRSTAAHSTLIIADSNSTAIHADGTLGKGVGEVELTRQESETSSRIEASHDGYARRHGFQHHRQLVMASDGRDLRGEDMLLPTGKRRKQATTGFAVRFHLAPGVEVSPTADGLAALLRLPGGVLWQFRCRGATLSIEASLWVDGNGVIHPTEQLVISGEAAAGGATVSWALKRAT